MERNCTLPVQVSLAWVECHIAVDRITPTLLSTLGIKYAKGWRKRLATLVVTRRRADAFAAACRRLLHGHKGDSEKKTVEEKVTDKREWEERMEWYAAIGKTERDGDLAALYNAGVPRWANKKDLNHRLVVAKTIATNLKSSVCAAP